MKHLREWHWVPLFYALVVIWIYRDLWHHHGVATGLGWDTIDTHGPDLDFFSSELRQGRFSLWNPYDKGGYPVFCDPVFDRYYPLNWPFGAWGALFGTSWWLVQVKVLAHHVIGASLVHAFARSRGLSVKASLVGGIGLVASAPLLIHKASNILWPMVWVPLVWMAIDWALAKPSAKRGVLVGGALLLPLTAGSPPGLVYAALLIAPYALWRFIQCEKNWKALGWTIGAAVLVVGLVVAVTVVPTSALVALGSRDRLGTGPGFALANSMYWPAAVRGVFVRGAGPFEIYCGAALTLLAVIGVVAKPRGERLLFIGLAVLGVVLAAGSTVGLLTFLVKHGPIFGLLRIPGRYKLVTAWALAIGAAYGVDALDALDAKKRVWIPSGVFVAVTITCVLVAGLPATAKDHPAWWSIVAIVVPAILVCIRKPWIPSVLALVVLIDVPLFTFVEPGAAVASEPRQLHQRDEEIVAKLPGVRDQWRVYDEFVLGERAGARLRIRDFRGYPAVDPISLHRYVDVLDFAKKNPKILSDFNVKYVLSQPHWRYGNSAKFPNMPARGFTEKDGVFIPDHPAAIEAWVGAVKFLPSPTLADVRAIEQGGARMYAVVDAHDAAALPPEAWIGVPGSAELQVAPSYEPDRIAYSTFAPRAGLSVLNEIMFPGWRVTVDGVAATPIQANYLLRAVWVPAGYHDVVWTFDPPHWRGLVAGYVLAWILIALAMRAAFSRRSR